MERGGGRSAEERAAAREARERARIAQEEGVPLDEGPDGGEQGPGWSPPEMDSMSRYGGGMDVFMRRRLIAVGAAIVVLLLLFLLLGGC